MRGSVVVANLGVPNTSRGSSLSVGNKIDNTKRVSGCRELRRFLRLKRRLRNFPGRSPKCCQPNPESRPPVDSWSSMRALSPKQVSLGRRRFAATASLLPPQFKHKSKRLLLKTVRDKRRLPSFYTLVLAMSYIFPLMLLC